MTVQQAGRTLLLLARNALHLFVMRQEKVLLDENDVPPSLLKTASTFVTLSHSGRLRGCIGSTHARLPLYQDVVRNTIAAARDPRFDPVRAAELTGMQIEISVLSPFRTIRYVNLEDLLRRLRPGVDGVLVTWQEQRGLLLPQVWERLPQPLQFMRALCEKARIPWDTFDTPSPQIDVAAFEALRFSDDGPAAPGKRRSQKEENVS